MYYYFRLVIKKIRIFIHNKFEKKAKSISSIDTDTFIMFLIKESIKNLIIDKKGIYFNTKIKNKNTPIVNSQARLISLFCDGFLNERFPIKDKILIEQLSSYLISMKDERNLYKFDWMDSGEGIASVWASIALIKSYKTTKKRIYLDETLSIFNAMLKNLYTPETGLVHTANQNFWCINASSKFAYLCSLILKHQYSHKIKEVMVNSINICIKNIATDGHFPYNEKHLGTYLLLYHPSAMFYLDKCLESAQLDKKVKLSIKELNEKALNYLIKCLDAYYKFNEPEIEKYNFYIITAVTALVALKDKINEKDEINILNNILKYYNNNKLYLFVDKNNRLFNSSRYEFKDVMTVETLYWMVQYIYGK